MIVPLDRMEVRFDQKSLPVRVKEGGVFIGLPTPKTKRCVPNCRDGKDLTRLSKRFLSISINSILTRDEILPLGKLFGANNLRKVIM